MVDIRRLGPGDDGIARRVMERFEPLRRTEDGDAHLHTLLADPRTHLVVALDAGAPVGMARAHELPRLDGPRPKLLLYTLAVAESHRRRGIGRSLIEALLRLGRERDCLNLWVITNEANHAAMRLYASAGAEHPASDDVVFVWKLEGQPA